MLKKLSDALVEKIKSFTPGTYLGVETRQLFVDYLKALLEDDERCLIVDGPGSYSGTQFTLKTNEYPFMDDTVRELCFEFTIDPDNIVVYTSHHNGFWVYAYFVIDNKSPLYSEVKQAIRKSLSLD